jgi:hypothetical protein
LKKLDVKPTEPVAPSEPVVMKNEEQNQEILRKER